MDAVRRDLMIVLVFFVALTLGVTAERVEAAAPKVMMMMAGSLPAPHSPSQAVARFVKTVQKDTNSEVTIRFFPGSELYADKDIPTAITQGACDMALTNLGTWSGIVPSVVVLDLGAGFYRDAQHFDRAQDGLLGKILAHDLEAKGVHLIGFATLGESTGMATGKKLIQKPSDLKGLLMRGGNLGMQWFAEALGAVPTFVSSSELYSALERGNVDGAMTALHSIRQSKWFEAAPNITSVMLSTGSPFAIVANLNRWKKLSPQLREILTKNWATEVERNRKEAQQQQIDAWTFFSGNPKLKTHKVTEEVQKKEWTPAVYEFQMKKLTALLGKEKLDQLLKALADTK
jgi:TRAP-type C4-dicarboxylate transport system substrate-binding protein